jgi:hypothetical protein
MAYRSPYEVAVELRLAVVVVVIVDFIASEPVTAEGARAPEAEGLPGRSPLGLWRRRAEHAGLEPKPRLLTVDAPKSL